MNSAPSIRAVTPAPRRVPLGADADMVELEVEEVLESAPRLNRGDIILDRYQVDCELGSGGMGVVYRARQAALGGRFVAIKHINASAFHPHDVRTALDSLRKEGLILATLRHPNLVQIYDCVEHQGDVFLVMEYVEGETLQDYTERATERVSFDALVGYGNQLSDVLGYLHTSTPPILFRDLKPSNVMLDATGQLRLIDFGVARSFGDASAMDREEGTPGFASPEQLRVISVAADVRSDVYSLGATLYFLATGKIPTDARKRVLDEKLTPVSRIRHDLPIRLQAVLKKSLMLNPEDRYQSVHEFQDALLQLQFEVNARETKRLMPYMVDDDEPAPDRPAMTLMSTAIITPSDVAAQRGMHRMKTLIISAANTLAGFGGRRAQPVLSSPTSVTAYIQDWRGRHEPLTLCAYRDELLTFVSDRRESLRFPLKIRFFLPGEANALERMFVQAFRVPDTSPQQYVVPMSETPYDLRCALSTMFAPEPTPADRRRRPRLRTKFQVTSDDLWGHRAVGMDVNAEGACIHTPYPVLEGMVVPVSLHIDEDIPEPLHMKAQVRWCEPQSRGGSYLGLQFLEPSREALDLLVQFERHMTLPGPIRL